MASRTPKSNPWSNAVLRATDATAAHDPGGMDEACWDDVAMRGIVAVVLYALHLRGHQPVIEIRWRAVLWQLRGDQRVDALITAALPEAGHDLSRTALPGGPVAECWRWLTRTWDEGTDPGAGGVRRAGPMGVSEIADKRYSFEAWGLAA